MQWSILRGDSSHVGGSCGPGEQEKELVLPAVQGTLNGLEAAKWLG